MMVDDMTRVRGTLEAISAGVMASRFDDIRWGESWINTISKLDVNRVVKSCLAVIKGGSASKAEIEEAKLCLHLTRGGFRFAQCLCEVKEDNCYRRPEREKIPDLWKKLFSYYRGQFPQLEMHG